MKTVEAIKILGMKSSAFYKLKQKLNIKAPFGIIRDDDFIRLKEQHDRDSETRRGVTKVYYRVSVKELGTYYVRHAGLTKQKAREIVRSYLRSGLCALMLPCSKTNVRH